MRSGTESKVTLAQLTPGMKIIVDSSFDCTGPGLARVFGDEHGLYFLCAEGHHYLDGQEDEDGTLVGISLPEADQ